jgi:hypothetical protein
MSLPRKKHKQHSRAPGPFTDRRVPVINTGFPPPPPSPRLFGTANGNEPLPQNLKVLFTPEAPVPCSIYLIHITVYLNDQFMKRFNNSDYMRI